MLEYSCARTPLNKVINKILTLRIASDSYLELYCEQRQLTCLRPAAATSNKLSGDSWESGGIARVNDASLVR